MNQPAEAHAKAKEIRKATSDALQRIYLIIVCLGIAQALIRTFTDQNGFVGTKLADPAHLDQVLLLAAFLPTVIRFAHGSILHLTALTGDEKWQWDMFGLLFQAVLFFIAALSTTELDVFPLLFAAIFAFDTLWLFVLKYVGHTFGRMEWQWIVSNIVLFLVFGGSWLCHWRGFFSSTVVASVAAIAAIIAAIFDYAKNRNEYFPKNA